MTTLRVVFETSLDESDAIQSIVEIFESQDWIQFPTYSPSIQEVGFISPRQFNLGRSQILCHDDLGLITIRYSARNSGNYLTTGISLVRNRQQGDCEQQLAMRQASFGRMSRSFELRQYLPRLEIPELQNSPRMNAFLMGGSSSSGNSIETEGVMTSDQDIEEVYRYFADQIEEQGWDLDSQAVGTLSATGTWTKSPESSLSLIGRLSILAAGDSEYALQFRLTAEGYTGDNSAIFSPISR